LTKPLYKIAVTSHFSSAHSLKGYDGACERVHGHNWLIRVIVLADTLNEIGMSIDFKDISTILNQITGKLDHRNLDTVEVFKEINPTAENLASYIYREVKENLPAGISLEEVEVSETDKYSVSYSE